MPISYNNGNRIFYESLTSIIYNKKTADKIKYLNVKFKQ